MENHLLVLLPLKARQCATSCIASVKKWLQLPLCTEDCLRQSTSHEG
jgi:hypothetical protein